MVDLDALVATAKKYLPPPLLLFLSHLVTYLTKLADYEYDLL